MGLIQRAKEETERITSDLNGFGVEITLTAPTAETVTLNGLHSKHHLGIDGEGNIKNTKNAHITVAEKFLTDAAYPVRVNGEVNLRNHKVAVKDSTGIVKNYIIREWLPNETTGLIICILGDFKNA